MKTKATIKEYGHLGLGYITKLDKFYYDEDGNFHTETHLCPIEEGLEIYLWDDDFRCRYTIATFKFDQRENTFKLQEVGDRLANPSICWSAFGMLYNLGREMLDSVERFLD